ncbi:STAS domain-containing protein [Streptomyces subrutilus]|uniref:STAS domain-containing protein n=1 Tax=Streptomyces subrutilus TaxID=36818 RepID=UPI0033D734C5
MDETHDRKDVAVVTAVGEFDAETLGPIRAELFAAAETHRVVVLDAAALNFADSSFLNLLIQLHRATLLRIAAPPHQLSRLFEMTGADQLLDVRPTLAEAVRS